MSKQKKQERTNQSIAIEDLMVQNGEAIQGGRAGDDKRQDYLTITLTEVMVS